MTEKKGAASQQAAAELTKQITFEHNGVKYTAEYSRRTVDVLQKQFGVDVTALVKGDVNVLDLPAMFQCSLLMHHPNMKQETAMRLFDMMGDRSGLLQVLVEMVLGTVTTLYEEPDKGKAISWARH